MCMQVARSPYAQRVHFLGPRDRDVHVYFIAVRPDRQYLPLCFVPCSLVAVLLSLLLCVGCWPG
jgi:hypothetical protein